MTAPLPSPEEQTVIDRFDAAEPAPESYIDAATAGFDPDSPHVLRTYGTPFCTVCGRYARDRLHNGGLS